MGAARRALPQRRVRRAVAKVLRLPSRVDLARERPIVIGAIGGSGTRVLRQVLSDAGCYMGLRVTTAGDTADLSAFLNRCLNSILSRTRRLDYGMDELPPVLRRTVEDDFVGAIRAYLADRTTRTPFWGWKIPRSLYILPLIDAVFPHARFIQLVRDGRDMAFSRNKFQLDQHFAVLMGETDAGDATAPMRLWAKANAEAADWASRRLGDRYRVVRFEDLCADPTGTIADILDWLGVHADPAALASAIKPPNSLGRWQAQPADVVAELEVTGGPTLARFAYGLSGAHGGPVGG